MPQAFLEGPKFLLPLPENTLLAVSQSQNLFRTMTLSVLVQDCEKVAELHFCKFQNMFDRRYTDNCLVALYNSDVATISRTCPFSLQPVSDHLVQLNSTYFMLHQAESGYVEVRCGETMHSHVFQGTRGITVPPGCRASCRSFMFDGSLAVFGEASRIIERIFTISNVFDQATSDTLTKMTEDQMRSLQLVGSSKGLLIQDLVGAFHREQGSYVWNIGFGTIIVVLGLVAVCFCCLQGRRFLRRRQLAIQAQARANFQRNDEEAMARAHYHRQEAEAGEREELVDLQA